MTSPLPGGVDCDLHPAVPHLTSLLPYMNDYWRDQVTTRGRSCQSGMPRSSMRVAYRPGIVAVARSSVFFVGQPHKLLWLIQR